MAAYSKRHYGTPTAVLHPSVIVLHFTEGDTWQSAWNTFAANTPNVGELPGTCSHFLIDKDGSIYATVPLDLRCRHTVGLNFAAIGIEFVQATHGESSAWADQQILHRRAQIDAGLALVRMLQSRYRIPADHVYGHATANAAPMFRDLTGRKNTHTDWGPAAVREFRSRLGPLATR
jgi:N-acetyl-anhydromuramyl-L-alanine amidase AmpD